MNWDDIEKSKFIDLILLEIILSLKFDVNLSDIKTVIYVSYYGRKLGL